MDQEQQIRTGSDGTVFEQLQRALEASTAEQKNYHIRQAQQLLLSEEE